MPVWKLPAGFDLVFENDPSVCVEMTLGFLGPNMMSPAVKMDSKVLRENDPRNVFG